jgi:A/G-specific adenine glycosylase
VNRTVGFDRVKRIRERMVMGHGLQTGPCAPARGVLERHEFERAAAIQALQLTRHPAAERAIAVEEDDEPLHPFAHERDGTLGRMAGTDGLDRVAHAVLPGGTRMRRLRAAVLAWFDTHGRAIDFRASADPYGILVGEVMAQQTQVSRVEPAWHAFMAQFPTPGSLAAAELGEVLRAWSGLGYNRRASYLWRAAIRIDRDHGGRLPRTVAELEALPGVGPYTARAVAAVAFGVPVGAVDTNVRRVVTRMLGGMGDAQGLPEAEVQRAADALIDPDRPADWTHALMDIGSTVCRGAEPMCGRCPLRAWCAFDRGRDVQAGDQVGFAPRRRQAVRFEDTRRWLRGRVIQWLVAQRQGEWIELSGSIGTHSSAAVRAALDALERESLVERDRDGRVRIPVSAAETTAAAQRDVTITAMSERTARPPSESSGPTTTGDRLRPAPQRGAEEDPSPTESARERALPAEDGFLLRRGYEFAALAQHWADVARRRPMSAEAMRGADRRAQAMGVPGSYLMEQAGAAVAAAARALLEQTDRWGHGPVLVLAGPGNNGGDGSVAARYLARAGLHVAVVLVATEARPRTRDAATNWDRLAGEELVDRIHAPGLRDVRMLRQGIDKASLVIDALLGTGVSGPLREPISSAVELANAARSAGVPVLAVDTPTAVDLTSGAPSDPVVRAHATITFHRPKEGLRTKIGAALAGRVLVAPIGIPSGADPG